MKKRMKMIITSAMLAFSLAMLSFGVFAASTHSLGINNYIMFDIGENIACDIEAVSAIGTSPSVTFGGTHNNSKTLSISADLSSESNTFTKTAGNTDISNGAWEPWTVGAPAELTMTNDTVYWLFKVTNTSENAIQVRVDLSRKNNYQRTILYGRSDSAVPNNTQCDFLEKDDIVYVLVALETVTKTKNFSENISFDIIIEPASASYLLRNWYSEVYDSYDISVVEFIGGDGKPFEEHDYYDSEIEYETFNMGATDKYGDEELAGNEEDNPYVSQITGYVENEAILYVHSPSIIYTPVYSDELFSEFDSIEEVYCIENFNTSNAEDMSYMFYGCDNLGYLEFYDRDTLNVANMNNMFGLCPSLSFLDIAGLDTSKVTDMSYMFCLVVLQDQQAQKTYLTDIDVTSFDTSNVEDMSYMFYNCNSLEALDVSGFNTSKVTDMSYMFYSCYALQSLDVSNFDTSNVENMPAMFNVCSALQSLDVSGFNTSKVTDMSYMFSGCGALQNLDVSNFDTSKVTDMSYMFAGCEALQSLDLSGFDTSNVENMLSMFNGCNELQSLDVSGFDTSNVENMSAMFHGCNTLQSLDLSSFNTSNVENMSSMFVSCSALESLDVSTFNTQQVTNVYAMFMRCNSLQNLDLSSFYIKDGCNVSSMFGYITNSQMTTLKTPYYVANNITIDISTLGFSISTISVNTAGSVGVTLTK